MRLSICALAVMVGGIAAPATQAVPDLSGTWVFAGERTVQPDAGPRPNFGLEFQLRQDAKGLTVDRTAGTQTTSTTYPFDGTEIEISLPQSVTKTRARWEDGRFVMRVTTTPTATPDRTTVSTRRLWIEGDSLLSEWVITSPIQSTSVSVYRHPPALGTPAPPARATIAALSWLVGNWEGKTSTTTSEERWTPASGGAMLGVSRTISGDRMVAFEFLRIVERNGTLVYLAQPNGRAPATEFTLTRVSDHEAVFENPAHDFPKMITYTLAADGTLTAVIADTGGLKPQHFIFKKEKSAVPIM